MDEWRGCGWCYAKLRAPTMNWQVIERMVLAEEREQSRLTLLKVLPDPSDQDVEGMQALYSSDLYVLLVEIRGWTPEQYIRWISELSLAAFTAKGVVQ